MMCALTDLSILNLPTENFCLESVIFYTGHSSTSEIITTTLGVCCLDMWRGCSDGFKTFGKTAGSSIAFHVLKSRAIQIAPLKRCDGSLQRVGDCDGLRPDAAAAPPSLLLLKIPLWLFWRARPWQSARLQTPGATL